MGLFDSRGLGQCYPGIGLDGNQVALEQMAAMQARQQAQALEQMAAMQARQQAQWSPNQSVWPFGIRKAKHVDSRVVTPGERARKQINGAVQAVKGAQDRAKG